MNFIKKTYFLVCFCFVFLIPLGNLENSMAFGQQQKDKKNIEFTEIRRLNFAINLKQSTIIKSTKEIKDLYKKLNDSKYSRSAPIPILENDNEVFLILKPRLKRIKYGDVEIEKILADGSIFYVTYKEIDNHEYFEKKLSSPIVILKVLEKPKEIKLIEID